MKKTDVHELMNEIEHIILEWANDLGFVKEDSFFGRKINRLRVDVNSLVDKTLLNDFEYGDAFKVKEGNNDGNNPDMVNHPAHYNKFTVEVKDTINEWVDGYSGYIAYALGNTLKYISRAPYKNNQLEDLKKASFYLDEAISELERKN